MKKLFARLVVLMTFVSCMQENELNPPQPLDVSIKAVATDTRTVLDGNDVKWENNDEIALLLVGDEKVVVNFKTAIDGDEPTAEADFTGTIAPEVRENEYQQSIAIYPSTAVTGEGEISFSLPQKQTVGADGSFESGLNLSSAAVSFDDLAESGEAEAKFKNALAILRFTLPENITEVSLTGTSPLAGKAPLVVVDNELGISEAVEWGNQILTVSPKLSEGSSTFESDKTYNLLVWPGEHNSLTVKMTDKDGCVYEKTVERKRTFEASKYYTLNFNSVFGKEFSATLSGREFAAEEQVAVVLGELYNETLTVAVEESTATISGSLPHTDETVNGYAVYPASVAETATFELPSAQTPSSDLELYTASLSSDALLAENASIELADALATLQFAIPEGVVSMTLTSEDPIAGTAQLKSENGELVVEVNDPKYSVTFTGAPEETLTAGNQALKVWPGAHQTLTLQMTDAFGCVAEKTFTHAETINAGQTYDPFDASDAEFTKGYEMTLDGRTWGEGDQVAVSLGEYKATLTVVDSKVSMTLPAEVVQAENLTGYVLYPATLAASMQYTVPTEQTEKVAPELYSAAVDKEGLMGDTQYSVTMSKADFATLRLTLPTGTKTVKVSSTYPFVGTAPLKVEDNKLVVDRDHWSENKGNSVSATPSDNKAEVVVFPGTYTLTVTLTDDDNCTIHKEFHEKEYKGEETLDLSSREFSKQYTVECDNDIEGPIMVAFDEEDPVEVTKEGKFVYNSHETYTTGFAFYPTDADTEGVSVPAIQTEETEKPELMSSSLNFVSNTAEAQFTNAFVTLNLTVPEGTTKVTLTSDDTPLAGTMKVVNKEVVIDENPDNATEVTLTDFTGTDCKIYVLPGTHTSLMAAIEDATGNTAQMDLTDQEFTSGKSSDIDLSDLTFYVLKVGDYVYKDGTTGTEYNQDAVGRVFWLDDGTTSYTLSTDPLLKDKYTKGLAYAIKGEDDLYKDVYIADGYGWGMFSKFTTSTPVPDTRDDDFTRTDIIRGLSNSKSICEMITNGYHTNASESVFSTLDLDAPAVSGSSPWFIPGVAELKLMNGYTPTYGSLWISTLRTGAYYNKNNCPYFEYSSNSVKGSTNKTDSKNFIKVFAF